MYQNLKLHPHSGAFNRSGTGLGNFVRKISINNNNKYKLNENQTW